MMTGVETMAFTATYQANEPTRGDVDRRKGLVVLEFGNSWCGYCQASDSLIKEAFRSSPEVEHIRIADGRGKPLGRSFGVKLWPTLLFLENGQEIARIVRPADAGAIENAFDRFSRA